MIEGKGKLGHLIREITKPVVDDPALRTWRSENSMAIAWLVNSMEPTIGKTHVFLPMMKKV